MEPSTLISSTVDDAAGVSIIALLEVGIRAILVPSPRVGFFEEPPPATGTEAEHHADGHPRGHPSRRGRRLVVLDITDPIEDPTSTTSSSGGGDGGGRGLPNNGDGRDVPPPTPGRRA